MLWGAPKSNFTGVIKITTFLALLKNDLRLVFRDWKAVLLLIVLPFLFIALFIYALAPYLNKSTFVEPFPIAITDTEDSAQTRILIRQLDEIGIFSEIIRTDEAGSIKLIKEKKAAAAVIIPPGFSESVVIGENKPVTVIGNKSMPLQSYIVRTLMQSAANYVSAGQSAINSIYHYNQLAGVKGSELEKQFEDSTMKIFVEVLARNSIFTEAEGQASLNLTPAEYFTSALIVVFLMFAGMPSMKMLITERSYGVSRRLSASPAKTWQILLSKFFVAVLLSLVQFSAIILCTSLIFKNYWGAPPSKLLALLGAIIFASVAWSLLVASICKTTAAADAVGNLGILLMAVMGGSIYPLVSMPGFVRDMSKITVNRWAMEGFMVIFSGNDGLSITSSVEMLLLIGAVMLALAFAFYRLFNSRRI